MRTPGGGSERQPGGEPEERDWAAFFQDFNSSIEDVAELAIGVSGRGRRFPAVLWHCVDQPRRVVVTEKGDADMRGIIVESEDEGGTRLRGLAAISAEGFRCGGTGL
jgi:hypothetical protein